MASPSPPKPWERSGNATHSSNSAAPSVANSQNSQNASYSAGSSAMSSSEAPALPAKPSSLNTVVNRTASSYSPYNANAISNINTTPYSGIGGYNGYSSPYSRFGSSMYGSGYGSLYGGMGSYGGMYGGMGGFGGRPGMMGEDPNSLTNAFSQNTQATFQIIESIVGAFGGFAQMLESTYMATHSSFFAMISVAEQFSNLRDTLGSILGIFAILRWLRTLFAKLTGRPPPVDATSLTPSAFAQFQGQPSRLPDGTPLPPRPSKKPFVVFILAAFGLPYLMGKMIRALARSQEEAAQKRGQQSSLLGPDGHPLSSEQLTQRLDPSQLDFCRVRYDFTPENTGQAFSHGIDVEVKKGDVVAVLAKTDPLGNASEWWKCRTRDGKIGYLPEPYLEVIKRPKQLTQGITTVNSSRAHTMTSSTEWKSEGKGKPSVRRDDGRAGDITAESFQKSHFYS